MRRWWLRLANVAVLGIVGAFVWRAVARQWGTFTGADMSFVDIQFQWILAAAVTTWLTYLVLIGAWRFVLHGWGQDIAYRHALRIWSLSNLGRYVPGKIWAVAGMAMLAKRQGVDGWAAAASALVMQGLAVTTGGAVVIATWPVVRTTDATLSPIYIGAALVLGVTGLALLVTPRFMHSIGQITNGRFQPKPLAFSAVAAGAGSTLLSWLTYGVAFWFLAHGVAPHATPGLALAIGSFAAAYVVGLIAVFAPGGIVVREGVLLALLAPQIGGPPALVLLTASRLLLTVTEVTAALFAMFLPGGATTAPTALNGEEKN